MSVDEDEESIDREVYEPKEDVRCMLQSCRFTMKMKMIESAWKQVLSLSVLSWGSLVAP
jgi:DNA-dependent protein kinase catalytic subunit